MAIALGIAVASIAAAVAPASPAGAEDGLEVTGTTTYTIDLPNAVVRARVDVSLINTVPDRRDGDYVVSTYWDELPVALHGDAAAVTVTTDAGQPLEVTVAPDRDFLAATVAFPDRLGHQERLDLVVTYDLPGYDPRSSELPYRVNEAYAAFPAYPIAGDPGRADVRIIAPVANDVTVPFAGQVPIVPTDSTDGDVDTLTFSAITDPLSFGPLVTATDDTRLVEAVVTVDDLEVVVQSWPDDPEWASFMTAQVTNGLARLETLIGRPVEGLDRLELRQSTAPLLEGYGGWFDLREGRIEVGEELDAVLALHELSHGWFNDQLSPHRWILEGLADTYANVVAGDAAIEPVTHGSSPPLFRLNDWSHGLAVADDEIGERYGYGTSHYVVDRLYDEIGADAMTDVLRAIDEGALAYPGDDEPAFTPTPAQWTQFLDTLEDVGGSTEGVELFRTYVVTADQAALLDERDAARDDYDALVTQGDEWAAPDGVRTRMRRWDFDRATELMAAATGVLDERDHLAARALAADVAPPDFERGYERADSIEDLEATADAMTQVNGSIDGLQALELAVAAERNDFEQLALVDATFDGPISDARTAITAGRPEQVEPIADDVEATMAEAESVGRRRAASIADGALPIEAGPSIAATAGVLVGLAGMATARRRERRRSGRVGAQLDAGSDSPVDVDVEPGIGPGVDLDEDALTRTGLGGVDGTLHVADGDRGQRPGTTGIVERRTTLTNVGDPVLQLDEDIGTVVDAEPVAGAEVLVDPDAHGGLQR